MSGLIMKWLRACYMGKVEAPALFFLTLRTTSTSHPLEGGRQEHQRDSDTTAHRKLHTDARVDGCRVNKKKKTKKNRREVTVTAGASMGASNQWWSAVDAWRLPDNPVGVTHSWRATCGPIDVRCSRTRKQSHSAQLKLPLCFFFF